MHSVAANLPTTDPVVDRARLENDKLEPQQVAGALEGTDLTPKANESANTGMTPKTTCTTPAGAQESVQADMPVVTQGNPVEKDALNLVAMTANCEENARADVASPSRNKKRKKKGNAYRRRQRKSAEKQEASFTRLAAVLGQIKEACAKEEVGAKVGPLIEVATGIVEALSTKSAIVANTTALQQKTNSDNSEHTNTSPHNQSINCSSPCGRMNYPQSSNVEGFTNTREWNCPEITVRAGQRIPPHVYMGGDMRLRTTREPQNRQMNGGNVLISATLARSPRSVVMSEREKEIARRERALGELRNRLRTAKSVLALQSIIEELEVMQADYELSVARAKLVRLTSS